MANHKSGILSFLIYIAVLLISACQNTQHPATPNVDKLPPKSTITPTLTPIPTVTSTWTPTSTYTPLPSPTATNSEPAGCQKPPDDYEIRTINGMLINARTYSMLLHAQELYSGELELTGYHFTQGSYTNLVSASFGTHDGGGAVDLSVIQYGTYKVLYDDIDPLVHALRVAGFAAWLRDFDQLYPGSPIHIHAIAIGDRDLSQAASDQLTGKFGYFRGYNGLPQEEWQSPFPDEHGGPVLCQWMMEMGYDILPISTQP
ncbi:MAG: hypothetical protein CVU39_19950 [Chloroflexi bacterium HGW-Chloroflexi-10]|nr:MAG: hypothetical protein CVU39_19950 [Chloroflexi bacterium HGW-Chloroflexi-10]